MKSQTNLFRSVFIFCSFFLFLNSNAQAPSKMSYQAVIRNATNVLVSNANVGVKISILQTSAIGTVVFSEYHTPTTNANGLVTLEIGGGTILTGNFVTINWANGPYFIKSETDPTGPGTNYTISGTSQLLSVPFALQAKKATTTESIGTSMSQNSRDRLLPSIGFTIYNTTTNRPNYYNGTDWMNFDNTSAKTLTVGMDYQGGLIAYLLQPGDTGYDVGVSHGFITTSTNETHANYQNQWAGSNTVTGATGTAVGTGLANTIAIVDNTAIEPNAARQCYLLNLNGFSDWYLPSIEELRKMHNNRAAIGGFDATTSYYWSSSEDGANSAKFWNSITGNSSINVKSYQYNIRPIRSF